MIPTPGRIVSYTLTHQDAAEINRRRVDAHRNLDKHRDNADGTQVHVGNVAAGGDVYPLVITRVWADDPTEDTYINGQVLLDGNDTLWVTSRSQGLKVGQWRSPVGD